MIVQLAFGDVFAARVALSPASTGLVTDKISSWPGTGTVGVRVRVKARVGSLVGVDVFVGVEVNVGVFVGVGVFEGVRVFVDVGVFEGVKVIVGVKVRVGVNVIVLVGVIVDVDVAVLVGNLIIKGIVMKQQQLRANKISSGVKTVTIFAVRPEFQKLERNFIALFPAEFLEDDSGKTGENELSILTIS